jgi:hypothetical protein
VDSLFIAASAGYSGHNHTQSCRPREEGCKNTIRLDAMPLSLGLSYRLVTNTRLTPVFHAGFAYVRIRAASHITSRETTTESDFLPGGQVRAGVELDVGAGHISFELGYLYLPWEGSQVLDEDPGGVSARLGLRVSL